MAPTFVAPYRIDAQPSPSRAPAKNSPFAASSAELDLSRLHSTQRLHEVWADIGARHTAVGRRGQTPRGQSRALHENEDDIINLLTLEIEVDRGVLRGTKPGAYSIGTFSLPGGKESQVDQNTREGEEDSDGSEGDWEELAEGDEDDVMGNWALAMDGPSILSRLRQRQNEEREDDLRAFLRDEARNQSYAMDEDDDSVVDLTDDFFAPETHTSSPRAKRAVKPSYNSPRPPPIASSSVSPAYRQNVVEEMDEGDDELGIVPVASPVVRSASRSVKPVDRKGKGKETVNSPTKLIRYQLEKVGIASPAPKKAASMGPVPYNVSRRTSLTTPTTSSPLRRTSFPHPSFDVPSRPALSSASPVIPPNRSSSLARFARSSTPNRPPPEMSDSPAIRLLTGQEGKENGRRSSPLANEISLLDEDDDDDYVPASRRRVSNSRRAATSTPTSAPAKRQANFYKPQSSLVSPATNRNAAPTPRSTRASSLRPANIKQPSQHTSSPFQSTSATGPSTTPKSSFLRQGTSLCDDDDPMQLCAPPRSRAQSVAASSRKAPTKRASSVFARPVTVSTPAARSRPAPVSVPKSAPARSRSVAVTPRTRAGSARASSVFSYQPIFLPAPSARKIDPAGRNVSDRTRSTSVSPQISLAAPTHVNSAARAHQLAQYPVAPPVAPPFRSSSVAPVVFRARSSSVAPIVLTARSSSVTPAILAARASSVAPTTTTQTPSPNKRTRAATEDLSFDSIQSTPSPRQRAGSAAPRSNRGRFARSVSASPGPVQVQELVGKGKGKERVVSVTASPGKKQKQTPSGISPLRGVLAHRTNFVSPFPRQDSGRNVEEDPLNFSPAGPSYCAPPEIPAPVQAVRKLAMTAAFSPKYSPSHRSPATLKRVGEVREEEESDDELSMEF